MCKKLLCLTSLILLCLAGTVQATTYYVSPSGNDNNNGTSPATAWKTIAKVNSVTFAAGDSILFEGGQTFSGSLYFDNTDGGTVASPLTVGSYGTGRATISSGSSNGLLVFNRAAFAVSNLNFVGSGLDDPAGGYGIRFKMEIKAVKLEYARVNNVDISGYRQTGIDISGWNAKGGMGGFKDVRITNAVVHDNADKAISSQSIWGGGEWPFRTYPHENIYVGNCLVYNNLGISGTGMHSGNGIVLGETIGATIEFCEAYNNGERNDAGGGPYGIWMWETVNGTIQFCESHHNKTRTNDGGGFDLDGGCQSCVMQYNYSHDNYGCGYLLCMFDDARAYTNNTVRYSISENDSLFIPQGGINFWAPTKSDLVQNTKVYNNTVYISPDSLGPAFNGSSDFITGTAVYNNIFVTSGQSVIEVAYPAGGYSFQGNCYWASGNPVKFDWGGTMYNSLAAFRTGTGQETLSGNPVGFEMDPNLFNIGGGGTIGNPNLLWTLNEYRLNRGNSLIGAGLDLQALFGINPGTRDFYGTVIPKGSAYDVGAHEFDSSAPPVSKADDYVMKMNTTLNVAAASGVLANDFAYKGSLTASLVSGPANGSLTLNSNGSFTYTPNTGFKGIDSFTYKASDGTDYSNISTVYLDVRSPIPVANNDNYRLLQDTVFTVDADEGVLANDEPAGMLTATLLTNPGKGTLNYFNSDGSFEYSPNAGFTGSDSFTYRANWGADSNTATVSMTVNPFAGWKYVVNNSFELDNAGDQITQKTTDMLNVMAWTNFGSGYCGVEPVELRGNPGSHGTCFAYTQHSGDSGFYQITDHNIAANTRYTLLWDGENIWQKNPTIITSFFYDDPCTGHTEITSKSFTLTTGFISETMRWGEDMDLPMEFITPSSASYIGQKLGIKFSFVNAGGSVYTAVDRVRLNVDPLELARQPNPADEVAYVPTNADLSWTAGSYAASHDVYLGTTWADVNSANRSSPEFKGNQTGTTFDPGIMTADTTYYWRIDEVSGATTWKGNVWSFKTQGPDYVASGEIAVTGLLSLDYTATQYSNDCYEWIREIESTGSPQVRYSYMEHKWTFNVPAGGTAVTFFVQAWHSENVDNDNFVFAYSTDNVTYTDMLTVTKISDNDTYQSYALPSGTSGTIYVRVKDTDQTAGNKKLDRIYVDNLYIRSEAGVPDTTPPTPNPMTWATVPYATGSTSIAMVATTASDPSGVEYYFDETSGNPGGSDSGWQDSTSYTDTGLSPGTTYTYRVQARDKSSNQNATGWSTSESATTQTGGDTTPPTPNPMTWATLPYATGSTSIAMVATTATDPSGVEYYFDETSGNPGGTDSGWQDSTSYTDTGLSPSTQYTYRVQARDKSANQNATGWSTSQSATTQSGGAVLFSDGFESGNFTTGGWTTQNSDASVTTLAKYTGAYGAKLKKTTWIEKAISTVGYTTIHVKYARWTAGFDAGEYLYVEWWDGSSWNVLETVPGNIGWTVMDMTCGSGANNNANFKARFRTNANLNNESAYIDDVEISGTP